MAEKISEALKAVDWNANVAAFCDSTALATRVEACNLRIAVWARQLELIEGTNSAIAFVREMQRGGHDVACTLSLALYKPAASAMRSLLECALYYAFFRVHPAELHTLVRDSKYYVSKKDITAYFAKHVESFSQRQSSLNYLERLESWYSRTSAIVHGQIPGVWAVGTDVRKTIHEAKVLEDVVAHFEEAVRLMQDTFLCAIGQSIWAFVESDAKEIIVKGMPGGAKHSLGLDVA